ncbi:MAG: biopolymer transporter ExbD [Candidatus Cloacimonetes bacterium]|nr:biopolymer transporter ExbD [Candidatus Cloacimonadota bacterium]
MKSFIVDVSHKSSLINSYFEKRKRKSKVIRLNITSLLDVLIILLVFLLMNYSTDPEINISKDIKLPYTTSEKGIRLAVNISVSPKWILLDGKPIIKMQEAIENNYIDIPQLRKALQIKAQAQKELSKDEFKGNVLLQADRSIPFKLIKKIMFTCGNTKYNNILLTLLSDETPHY